MSVTRGPVNQKLTTPKITTPTQTQLVTKTPIEGVKSTTITAKPVATQQKTYDSRGALGRIYEIYNTNPAQGEKLYKDFKQLQADPTSQYYRQYSQPTNRAVSELKKYGINANELNDDWFAANSGWIQSNLIYSGTSNSPTKPNAKKGTAAQWAAYWLNQYYISEDQTKKAEKEAKAASNEARYWASRSDRNYSDEEVIAKVRENFATKYPTLNKMENGNPLAPMELNRGIDFSDDILYGAAWEGRNPDFKGNIDGAMASSAIGTGNQYQYNQQIADRLNPKSPNFQPYFGGTNLDEEALYFGVPSFTDEWIAAHDGLQYEDTQEGKYMRNIIAANANQKEADTAVDALDKWMNQWARDMTPEKAQKKIDDALAKGYVYVDKQKVDISILNRLDKSMGKGEEQGTGNMIPLTRGIDYKYSAAVSKFQQMCGGNGDGQTYTDEMAATAGIPGTVSTPDQDRATTKAKDEALAESAELTQPVNTPAEQAANDTQNSVTYGSVKAFWTQMFNAPREFINNIAASTKKTVIGQHAYDTLGSIQEMYDYDMTVQNIQSWQLELDKLAKETAAYSYIGKSAEGEKTATVNIDGQNFNITISNLNDIEGKYDITGISQLEGGDVYGVDNDTLEKVRNSEEVQKLISDADTEADKIRNANQPGVELTKEQTDKLNRMRELELQIEDAKVANATNEQRYQEASEAFDLAQQRRSQSLFVLKMMGIDTTDIERADYVVGRLAELGEYEATVWNAYNPSDVYRAAIASGEDRDEVFAEAEKGNAEVVSELEEMKAIRDYVAETEMNVPSNYINNLNRKIAKLERDVQDYEDFILMKNDDFDETVQKGRQMEYDSLKDAMKTLGVEMTMEEYFKLQDENPYFNPAAGNEGFSSVGLKGLVQDLYSQMTEDEKNIYYYLMGKGNTQRAIDYVNSLRDNSYGVLHTRFTNELKEYVAGNEETGEKGLIGSGAGGFIGGNILAILAAPFAAMTSLGYMGYSLITGEELNPNNAALFLNNFRTTTREASAKEISDYYGEGTIGQKLVQVFYEMLTNRLDSLANGVAFGGLAGGIGNSMLSEWINASPMGVSAAMDAMMQAKTRGATDAQAWGIGFATFAAETVTEAVSLENIKEAFAIGKDVTSKSIKDFLKNWLKKTGVSEMIGESFNDIVENLADDVIMGELSEHNDLVWHYRMQRLSKEDAEAMALLDGLKSIAHTALISYLSPGLDIGSFTLGRAAYYRDRAKYNQTTGTENVSAWDLYKREKNQTEEEDNHEPGSINLAAVDEFKQHNNGVANGEGAFNLGKKETTSPTTEAITPEASLEEAGVSMPKERFDTEFEALETAKGKDVVSQTGTIASVLDETQTPESGDAANAAAANLQNLFGKGKNAAEEVQNLLIGANLSNTTAAVKQAVQTAAMSTQSAAYQVMQSEEYQVANPEQRAEMLAATVETDAQNLTVQNQIAKAVYENRLARAEQKAVEDPAVKQKNDKAYNLQGILLQKQEVTQAAQNEFESALQNLREKQKNVQTAGTEYYKHVSNRSAEDMLNHACKEATAADIVKKQRGEALEKAKRAEQKAQEDVDRAVEDVANTKREIAKQMVEQEDQERAVAAEQAAVEAQAQAIQDEQNRIAQEETDNATIADAEGFIAQQEASGATFTEEEKQKIRDEFAAQVKEQQQNQAPVEQTIDENAESDAFGRMDDPSAQNRRKAAKEVERRFGYKIVPIDTVKERNFYFEGQTDRKNRVIYLDSQTVTTDDIMYRVLGHELNHLAEKAGERFYNSHVNAIARIFYGSDANVKQAISNLEKNNGVPTSRLEADIVRRKHDYDSQLGTKHDYKYIAEEVMADRMGDILFRSDDTKRQELVDRLVADDPGTARRLLDSLKSVLKKAVGMKGAWQTNAQKSVDMLARAIDRANTNSQTSTDKEGRYMLRDSNENTLVEGEDGEPLATELPGGTVIADTNSRYSLSSFTPEEQERVRQALYNKKDANGKKEFTKKEVDKYLEDAMGIAKLIADDRQRLDFVASDNQVFLKPNNDYHFTLDASTLCAKRLLYQGTFDYVQHALPDEVFTPEDLIDLVNIMNEMGYETPCGICYVESRRRWLDTYANEFIENVQKNEDGYVEKFIQNKFKKSSEEEKAALRERLAGEMPSVDDLTTSDGLEKLRKNDPLMYKAFVTAMNAKGSANPKVVQLRTEYRGDIGKLSKKDIQKVKDIGGLRIQSFSDFETPHLLDMVQAVLDMSSVGLTSQAYTKVPNFAWVFGDTGIKINLSLIGKGTGLDENGNLVFDNREGMDFDEAMKLRERYNKNVGTILVGINDDHIIAAMGDPRIDFIIPFHKSGWSSEELRKMPTLNNYNDYTSTQNELMIVGDRKHKVKEIKNLGMKALDNWIVKEGDDHPGYKVIEQGDGKYTITYDEGYETESFKTHKERTGESLSNFEPVGANAYWDFSKSGEWNANKYLKMCAESGRIPKFSQFLVDNGDGSFSLPKGKDKRSTAIREGYWKTLIDFKMYENDGYGRTMEDGKKTKVKGSKQMEVTPNINMNEAYRVMNEYQLGRQMPDKENGAKGAFIPMKSNNDVPVAVPPAERFIELIKRKREGEKPVNPDDTLEASPSIDVGSLGQSAFHQGPSNEVNMNARTAFGATEAPAVLGNEGNEYVEPAEEQKAMYADEEAGDTGRYRYSLPSDEEETRLRGLYEDAHKRSMDLSIKYRDIQNSDEYKAWEERIKNTPTEEIDKILDEYKQWDENVGFSETYNAKKTADLERTDTLKALENYIEERDVAQEQKAIAESGMTEPEWRRKQAVSEFGYTTNMKEAGYLLPNGKMLNFSGEKGKHYGYRAEDHRGIGRIYASGEIQGTRAMNTFMNGGNIRMMPESPGVDISIVVEPTKEQYAAIRNMARQFADDEYFSVDLSDENGRSVGNLEYEGRIYPDKIVNEIKRYFQTGEVPEQSSLSQFRYSLPSDAPYLSAVDHGDMETAQRMVDEKAEENGYTMRVYHGTPYGGFTKFHDWSYFTENKDYADRYNHPSQSSTRGRYDAATNPMTYGLYMNPGRVFDTRQPEARELFEQIRMEQGMSELTDNGLPDWTDGRDLIEYIEENDLPYDTIVLNEGADGGYGAPVVPRGESYVTRSNMVKSADPVTYDDAGNVIPLSERFNTQNNDIRYSLPSDDVLRQQIRQYIANGGVLGQQNQQSAPLGPNEGYRQWGNEGAQRSDELDEQVKQLVLNNPYTKDTNAAELNRAVDWIRRNKLYADDDGFNESLRQVTDKKFNYRTKDGQARMIAVMALAVAKNDVSAQADLAEAYNRQGTDLGQALQARKLFRLMTPMGRVAALERMVGNVRRETGNDDIKLSDWIIQAASEASDEGTFNRIRKAAAAEIAQQIPANWRDKLRSLRMLSMLGNPKTHVRNFIGNALFVPVVGLKNKLGAALEMATHQNERTKTLALTLNKEVRDFVRKDAEFKKDELTGEAKYNDGSLIQREQKAFSGFLQKLIDFNSNALENEDWFFLKGHYRRALGGWIQANGYTIDQLKSDPALLEKGRAYAINEAQKATYRDFNGLADKLNKMTQRNETKGQKALGFAVDAILPFRKTPANILKRGLEYSPVGLVRSLKNAMVDMKNGTLSANQVIDRFCSGLAGTAVMALGYFLSKMGMVTCGMDDDDDKFEKEQGNQKYSIKLFGQDVTTTLDWAAPVCMPFFVGAALQNEMAKDGDFDVNEAINAISNIGEPVLNLSMLDGVNTLFQSAQNSDTDAITQIGAKVLSNYASSYVPSFLGAVARTFDDYRRATYVPSGQGKGVVGTFNYAKEQIENKIPGLSQTNIPVRDVFGNAETKSFAMRAFENFIWPGYIKNYKNDPILNEMDRLYNANVTDSNKMIPKDPPKTIEYDKQKYVLDAQQWDTYKLTRGQTAYSMLTELINSKDYQDADDEAQIQMIDKVWKYADKVGKKSIIPDFDIGEENIGTITKGSKASTYKDKMMKSLENGDYEGYETMVEALRELDVEDSTIKEKIGDKYRKEYKKAYVKDDTDKMSEIEEILFYSGFDFDFGKWEEQAEQGKMN